MAENFMERNVYRVNLRELNFLLWEQLDIEKNLFSLESYEGLSKTAIISRIHEAKDFAYKKLGPAYQSSDREGCKMQDSKTVKIPNAYSKIWEEYKKNWAPSTNAESLRLPYVVHQMVAEMFMGANPSFITYSGFAKPSAQLIERFGTHQQKKLFTNKLLSLEWTACLCLTEPQAGSDISAIETVAIKQTDGTYVLKGEKVFISAGMHQLTNNIIYFVMAKTMQSQGMFGLSCFIVPKFWVQSDGIANEFNNVTCMGLADKMGFNGCANTHLLFGHTGKCRAYLLGEKENIGLIQLMTLMNQARISTGIFALGMASSAYLNSIQYAHGRIQGKRYAESFNPRAPRVSILTHYDIQRILLEMKCKVEGCRTLIARLAYYESLQVHYARFNTETCQEKKLYYESLVSLMTPIVKAYTSDEAWKICELAIQVFGGNGYIRDFPVEQYARDVKVLSIWEGTNYIQSQDLVRDKLSMGRDSRLFKIYLQEFNLILEQISSCSELTIETKALKKALKILQETLLVFGEWVKNGKINLISGYSTIFLKMIAKCTISLFLLEAAKICIEKLRFNLDKENKSFYEGKVASAKFYINNILPYLHIEAASIKSETINFGTNDIFNSDLLSLLQD